MLGFWLNSNEKGITKTGLCVTKQRKKWTTRISNCSDCPLPLNIPKKELLTCQIAEEIVALRLQGFTRINVLLAVRISHGNE